MNSTRTTLLFLSFWAVFVVAIYFAAFWTGNSCDSQSNTTQSQLEWKSGENTPWFKNHLEFYPKRNLSTLRLLHALIRHGDRTSIGAATYPNDPYGNETFPPIGWGKLTNKGKRRSFEIGRSLRYQYDEFLGDYNMDFLSAISSEVSRCRNSLQLILAGLFPPRAGFTWMRGFNWQPIKFDVNTGKDNMLGNPRFMCNGWPKIYEESHAHFGDVMTNYSKYFDWLEGFTGMERNLLSVNILYHSIIVNLSWGNKLDKNFEAIWPEPTTTLNSIFWNAFSHTEEAKRAGGGKLFERILEHSKEKVMGNHSPKFHIYAGSDINIAFLLSILGQTIQKNPSYGAQVLIELHHDNGDDYFKFFYRDDINGPAEELFLPDFSKQSANNETICMFNDFYNSHLRYKFDPSVC